MINKMEVLEKEKYKINM